MSYGAAERRERDSVGAFRLSAAALSKRTSLAKHLVTASSAVAGPSITAATWARWRVVTRLGSEEAVHSSEDTFGVRVASYSGFSPLSPLVFSQVLRSLPQAFEVVTHEAAALSARSNRMALHVWPRSSVARLTWFGPSKRPHRHMASE